MQTPKDLGFYFPAEWHKHVSTWLSYPHNENSFPDKIHTVFPYYNLFIKEISKGEIVNINVLNTEMQHKVEMELNVLNIDMKQIRFHLFKTDDAWCRDHGPAFVIKDNEKAIVDWNYNAWGNKYPYYNDNLIPLKIAEYLNLKTFKPNIVMEGGSVDFNGKGSVLTTTACLLNKNRNPQLNQGQIEKKLAQYYGIDNIIWLKDGIVGDDTDGHVDDIARFVATDIIITVIEENKSDDNYVVLQNNLSILSKSRLENGKQPTIVTLPMPEPVIWDGQRLPASYANFYISNAAVIVPVYRCKQDNKAIYTLEECFKDRKIVAIDSTEIIWGLGSFHCLSQQEPDL
ncbi:MAG: agmatine deiminase family protein [Bacteroidales bacterium]|jgi:agmatine deiminase|nr:agmatine deiminase family protein [Bacteroidales bacterium]